MLFSYIGPETIMPLASVLAAVIGGLLLFWNALIQMIKRIARQVSKLRARPVLMLGEDVSMKVSNPLEPLPIRSEIEAR